MIQITKSAEGNIIVTKSTQHEGENPILHIFIRKMIKNRLYMYRQQLTFVK